MSGSYLVDAAADGVGAGDFSDAWAETLRKTPRLLRYVLCALLVGLAVAAGYGVEGLVSPANVALVFVLPVVVAATTFGWGPAFATVVASVLAFDYFFTEPRYQLTITSPTDIWAAALLLVIAALVSAVGAQARRLAIRAQRAAQQAGALHVLAHVVIGGRPRREIVQAAAIALSQVFDAPSVIFSERGHGVELLASANDAAVTPADEEAALGVLSLQAPSHAGAYPFEASRFDFWPLRVSATGSFVLGVDFSKSSQGRPAAPERLIEVVGAYLAAAGGGSQ